MFSVHNSKVMNFKVGYIQDYKTLMIEYSIYMYRGVNQKDRVLIARWKESNCNKIKKRIDDIRNDICDIIENKYNTFDLIEEREKEKNSRKIRKF